MKILRLRAYYSPEVTSGTHLDNDLNEGLANNDMLCVNYTPIPTRGVGKKVTKIYKERKHEQLFGGKIIVNRFPMFKERRNIIQRASRYICCSIVEYFLGVREKEVDLVYSSSTPPTQGLLSALVAKKLSSKNKKKVPFIYNLQDIFPDSLVNAGITHKKSFLWKIGRVIEDYTYKKADKIIVISNGFKKNIVSKGVPEEKIEVISNWIDIESVHPIARENNSLVTKYNIDPSKYIVVYAGNFGAVQGAEIILDVARNLKEMEEIQFVIFGAGLYFEEAKKKASGLRNVVIDRLQPPDMISEVYSLGDIALITCKPGTGDAGMPSKVWSIMACNTSIIASFDINSDLADVLKNSGAGKCVEPGNVTALCDSIYTAYKEKSEKEINSRDYVRANASKEICVSRYIETIKDVYNNKK